jgi:hypothetical protein
MARESALIIPIPEVEVMVGALRLQYDAAARPGVPAQVTLLYPFRTAQTAVGEIKTLTDVCASIETFPFSFTGVRRFSATSYLHPDRSETFAQMTRAVLKMWPACKPYGRALLT